MKPAKRTAADEVRILKRRCRSFADWIADEELTLAQVAERLGITLASVANLRNGNRGPSLALASKIAEVTGGKVPIEAWTS